METQNKKSKSAIKNAKRKIKKSVLQGKIDKRPDKVIEEEKDKKNAITYARINSLAATFRNKPIIPYTRPKPKEKENNDKLLSAKEMAAKLKQENDIKILAHGFDLETSFRTVISWKKKSKELSVV